MQGSAHTVKPYSIIIDNSVSVGPINSSSQATPEVYQVPEAHSQAVDHSSVLVDSESQVPSAVSEGLGTHSQAVDHSNVMVDSESRVPSAVIEGLGTHSQAVDNSNMMVDSESRVLSAVSEGLGTHSQAVDHSNVMVDSESQVPSEVSEGLGTHSPTVCHSNVMVNCKSHGVAAAVMSDIMGPTSDTQATTSQTASTKVSTQCQVFVTTSELASVGPATSCQSQSVFNSLLWMGLTGHSSDAHSVVSILSPDNVGNNLQNLESTDKDDDEAISDKNDSDYIPDFSDTDESFEISSIESMVPASCSEAEEEMPCVDLSRFLKRNTVHSLAPPFTVTSDSASHNVSHSHTSTTISTGVSCHHPGTKSASQSGGKSTAVQLSQSYNMPPNEEMHSRDTELQQDDVDDNIAASATTDIAVECAHNVTIGNKVYKRKWDKKYFCPFCTKGVSKLPKHLLARHREEPEVTEVEMYPIGSVQRKFFLEKLQRLGTYKHNTEVYQKNTGSLVPMRRPRKQCAAEDFKPCEYCLALFQARDLWKHVKVCRHKPGGSKQKHCRYRSSGHLLFGGSGIASDGLKEDILRRMNQGKVAVAVRNDTLITRYGNNLHFQHGHAPHRLQYISQKLRQLGRFLITVRSLDSTVHQLSDCIAPSKFEVVVQAVRIVSGFDDKTHLYKVPSLPLKLGHSFHDCANILKADAIKRSNSIQLADAEKFVDLYKMQWAKKVSSHALRTMTQKHKHESNMLPLANDLQKLQTYLRSTASVALANLQNEVTLTDWTTLSGISLAQLVLFNRRRGGEAQRLTVADYSARVRNQNDSLADGLSEFEKKLLNKFCKVNITGKRGRTVPILLTEELETRYINAY